MKIFLICGAAGWGTWKILALWNQTCQLYFYQCDYLLQGADIYLILYVPVEIFWMYIGTSWFRTHFLNLKIYSTFCCNWTVSTGGFKSMWFIGQIKLTNVEFYKSFCNISELYHKYLKISQCWWQSSVVIDEIFSVYLQWSH